MPLAQQANQNHTYQDYLTWPDDERWEIIAGRAYDMTPAPLVRHQSISRNIEFQLISKIRSKDRDCQVFDAPTDVVFDKYNVVQPDVFVVCDRSIITKENIKGAPDFVIEIISPSTSLKDKREKKNLYEKFSVKEYLIIYPDDELVERFILENDRYGAPNVFNWDETMRINILDLEIELWDVFEKEKGDRSQKAGARRQKTEETKKRKEKRGKRKEERGKRKEERGKRKEERGKRIEDRRQELEDRRQETEELGKRR